MTARDDVHSTKYQLIFAARSLRALLECLEPNTQVSLEEQALRVKVAQRVLADIRAGTSTPGLLVANQQVLNY